MIVSTTMKINNFNHFQIVSPTTNIRSEISKLNLKFHNVSYDTQKQIQN